MSNPDTDQMPTPMPKPKPGVMLVDFLLAATVRGQRRRVQYATRRHQTTRSPR